MKYITFIVVAFYSTCLLSQAPDSQRKLAIHAEYQICKYDYFQVGIGFNPKKHLIFINRDNEHYFQGYRFSYAKNFNNADWGLAVQSMVLGGDFGNVVALGAEVNYKSIDRQDHFGLKPLVGLSFPYSYIMYGYNVDFYNIKSERVSQHEIIFGLNLAIFKW